MNKIKIKIDATKIPREKIIERRYTNKAGHEVIVKDIEFDIVPKKEPKLIKEGDTWQLWETHFVSLSQTAQERQAKEKGIILGNGYTFTDKKEVQETESELTADEIGF